MKKLVAVTLLSAAFPAVAADNGFYAGVTVGRSRFVTAADVVLSKSTDTIVGLLAGYQFNKNWGAEVFYTGAGRFAGRRNFGGPTYFDGSGEGSALGIDVVGRLPLLQRFSLYGKVGVASAILKASGSRNFLGFNTPRSYSEGRYTPTVGLGVQYDFNQTWGLRLGGDWFGFGGNRVKADIWSLGILYKF